MSQLWFYDVLSRRTGFGYRGKVLAVAGLGICALPAVLLVLIWQDIVLMAGLAPLLAIGSAAVAATATLLGLDLLLRPVSLTGQALRQFIGGHAPVALPQTYSDQAGRLMADAQRLIDELIALRADRDVDEGAALSRPAPSYIPAPDMDQPLLEYDLRQAVERQEFELYYQPVMDLSSGYALGAEALIRWNSPTRGFVAPGMFLPLAEVTGLITPIGLWVLHEACREAAVWGPGMRVSVNLGAAQVQDPALPWQVSDAIIAAGIGPDQLEIELTEAVAMVDLAQTRRALTRLRDLGVRVAVDDFGAGVASLTTLCDLPFSTLKIDRSFVTDVHLTPASQAMCSGLIAMGQGLGVAVLAKGCETPEEVAFLRRKGCHLFQGYYFARPVPAHALGGTFQTLSLRKAG
jgi:EAL domain-containing protein (putative c-di-GMP-specific phosphodiesterase class I)